MKAQHTPGPWEYVLEDDGETSGVTFVIRMDSHLGGENGWQTQHRIEYEVPSEEESPAQFAEAKANVQLIVASPTLLAIAEEVDRQVSDGECCPICSETPHRKDCALDLAVARARGLQR